MFRFLLSVFVFVSSQALAATKPFALKDCESYVTSAKGRNALAKAGLWLTKMNLADLEVQRVDISQDNLLSDHTYSGVDDEFPAKFNSPLIKDSPLSPLEQKALGISGTSEVLSTNFRGRLRPLSDAELILEIFDRNRKIGETILHSNRLRLGFQNRVEFYQSYWKTEGYETDIAAFFHDSGYILLPSENGFAFVFSLAAIEKPVEKSEYFEFSIFKTRECPGREAVLMKDYIFPQREAPSGSKNLCLDDLGLKLVLPYKGKD